MLALSDDELQILLSAARPIPPRDRYAFLRDVAVEVARYPEVRPGVNSRVCSHLQHEHRNGVTMR